MDMSDDWQDEPDLPDHVPPKEDRLWAHPSEYRGPQKSPNRRITVILGTIAFVIVGLVIAKVAWPTKAARSTTHSEQALKIGNTTSAHIENLAKAIVTLVPAGKQKTTLYGLAISKSGYILVPANVIGSNKVFSAATPGNTSLQARLVAENPTTDTAVLKVSKPLSSYVSGTSRRNANPGEMTIGIGPNSTPAKPDLVISQIQKAGIQESFATGQTSNYVYLADPAQKFNPQGLLFVDSQGDPLGIGLGTNSGKWVIAPLSEMLAAAQKIELNHGVPQGWLGIVGTSAPPTARGKGPQASQGVVVFSVASGSPAQKAGVKPRDEIVALDNITVTSLPQLQGLLTQFPSGTQVTLSIVRDGQRLRISIQLGVKSAS